MKILFAGASGDRYGADAVLAAIAVHMQSRGVDCLLVLPENGPGRDVAVEEGLRVEIVETPVLRRSDLSVIGLLRLLLCFVTAWASHVRALRRERPDVIWVNTITIPLWSVVGRLLNVCVVCHGHEIVGSPRWLRRLLYLPLFLAHRIVLVSDACRSELVATYPRLERRALVVVNPSFSVPECIPIRKGAESNLVIIGRVSQRKGLAVLMDALDVAIVARYRPVVHVCGDAYRSRQALAFASRLRARALTTTATVHFHGYVPTRKALEMGGIVVVPSVEPEACPLVVAEAIVAGRAVVASDCGGVAEVAGGAAALVAPGDVNGLAEMLARLISEPAERAKLVAASLIRAEALSVERYAAVLERMIRELGHREGTLEADDPHARTAGVRRFV
jgi:glycosyltransferase involved in cell wall biosynthesis